jgi:hypothetical protein
LKSFHSSAFSNVPKRWKEKSAPPFQHELKNPVEVVYGGAEKWPKDVFGKLYDKKPFKVSVKKYHLYKWCGCGWSHSQPFCDETCINPYYKRVMQGSFVTYIAPGDALNQGDQRAILNFTPGPQGRISPLGVNLSPRSELVPKG